MNLLLAAVLLFTLSHLHLVAGHSLGRRIRRGSGSGKYLTAAVASGPDDDDSSYGMGDSSSAGDLLDRNMVVACTNRHNCEMMCAKTKAAKYASKSALLDALSASIGEDALTDAHKLGIQFGRRKSCDNCALVYSNCDNTLYGIARQQLFGWRSTPDDMISLPKSSQNTL